MKQSEKLTQLLELMQANPGLPVIPCVDGDVVGGDEYYCWLGSWGESGVQEFIIGKERTYYREDDICEMNDVLYERYDPELVDNMTDEETRAAYNTGKMKIFPSGKTGCSTTINTRRMGRHERKTSRNPTLPEVRERISCIWKAIPQHHPKAHCDAWENARCLLCDVRSL